MRFATYKFRALAQSSFGPKPQPKLTVAVRMLVLFLGVRAVRLVYAAEDAGAVAVLDLAVAWTRGTGVVHAMRCMKT